MQEFKKPTPQEGAVLIHVDTAGLGGCGRTRGLFG